MNTEYLQWKTPVRFAEALKLLIYFLLFYLILSMTHYPYLSQYMSLSHFSSWYRIFNSSIAQSLNNKHACICIYIFWNISHHFVSLSYHCHAFIIATIFLSLLPSNCVLDFSFRPIPIHFSSHANGASTPSCHRRHSQSYPQGKGSSLLSGLHCDSIRVGKLKRTEPLNFWGAPKHEPHFAIQASPHFLNGLGIFDPKESWHQIASLVHFSRKPQYKLSPTFLQLLLKQLVAWNIKFTLPFVIANDQHTVL